MAKFNYIAKNRDGQEIRSMLDAETRLDALEILRKKGLVVIDLLGGEAQKVRNAGESKGDAGRSKATGRITPALSSKVNTTDLAVFCRQLAISVNAGIPLRDALEGIGTELEQPVLRRVCQKMVKELHDGKSFSEAVAQHSNVFNEMFCGLVKVAEESGKLPQTLRQLAGYLERTDKLQRRIKAMAAYPMFIGVFFLIVCLAMTLFILPKFSDVFGGLGTDLPALTKIVFGANSFFVENIVFISVCVVAGIAAIVLYGRTPAGSFNKDRLKLAMPYTGRCLKKYVLARFCRSLSIMVHSGVPISSALEICAQATGNQVLQRNIRDVREWIVTGGRIAASLEKSGIFPGLIVRMVAVGEDSGQLPEVLESVADLYEDQVEVSIMTTMSMFEPVVICVFGAFVLVIVLAIYMPMFTISSGVR